MATINATISVNSDIMSYPININTSMVMNKFQSCHGLEETSGMNVKKFNAVTAVKIIDNTEGTAGKASKVYIRNTGSSKTNFFYVAMANGVAASDSEETIGKLYGGDWMLMPYNGNVNITVASSTDTETQMLEYMVFADGIVAAKG